MKKKKLFNVRYFDELANLDNNTTKKAKKEHVKNQHTPYVHTHHRRAVVVARSEHTT